MPRVILPHEQDGRISCFVADQLDVLFHPPFTMMGLEQDGQIIAGIIFNCFETHDVHATIAGHGWSLRFLRALGWYLFDVLRVERFTGITEKQNVIDICQRLGGQQEGVMRSHFGPGRNAVIMGILRDEYRYYRHGFDPQGPRRDGNGASAG